MGIAPGFRVIFLAFNVNIAPLDNPMLREAIDRAIDRESLTKNLLRGLGKPTGIMVPPMNIGYDESRSSRPRTIRDAARKLVSNPATTASRSSCNIRTTTWSWPTRSRRRSRAT